MQGFFIMCIHCRAYEMVTIQKRQQHFTITDPQRRCYDGYIKGHHVWGEWFDFDSEPTIDRAKARIEFWQSLNQVAVDGRGEGARAQFRMVEE